MNEGRSEEFRETNVIPHGSFETVEGQPAASFASVLPEPFSEATDGFD